MQNRGSGLQRLHDAYSMCIGCLVLWKTILALASALLLMYPIYTLLFVYKICWVKRTILLLWKMDLIFLSILYSIMEMLLHYQTLLKG